jgi:hypothetical protein
MVGLSKLDAFEDVGGEENTSATKVGMKLQPDYTHILYWL